MCVHGLLKCIKCDKSCLTVSAFHKHMYEHSSYANNFSCADCNKSYPFANQLKNHRKIHLTALEHGCIHCQKWFKSNGELVKHLAVHSGKTWYRDKCTYSCKDPRNLRAHSHKHGDKTRYICGKCHKGFNHYMQLKCHRSSATLSKNN